MLRDDRLWWVLAVLAAAAGAALGLRRPAATAIAPRVEEPTPQAREPWTCTCGQAFVVAGRDRHRVYWIATASEEEPVLGNVCPSCDRELPV
jgi:hypothetical protein